MATVIKTKNGSGAPLASDLVQGELAIDLTNKRLYTENASGTVIELGTVPSTIDINAGTIDGTVIGGTSAAAGSFTTLTASGEITANAGIALPDNQKATFGASDDLQIYHDGSASYISDQGTGNLKVLAGSFRLRNSADTENIMQGNENGTVSLYYDDSVKFATTVTGIDVTGDITLGDTNPTITFNDSSVTNLSHSISSASDNLRIMADVNGVDAGSRVEIFDGTTEVARFEAGAVDVTGTVTADGLTSDNYLDVQSATGYATATLKADTSNSGSGGTPELRFELGGTQKARFRVDTSNNVEIATGTGAGTTRFGVASNGDISFYEDTGTTAKFYWDASAEFLGIGTSTPSRELEITGAGNVYLKLTAPTSTDATAIEFANVDATWTLSNNDSDDSFSFSNGSERMRIDSAGNVGIGVTPESTWDSGFNALQVGSRGALWSSTGASGTWLTRNAYYDGTNFKYVATDEASAYEQGADGSHRWSNASSGTADTTLTLTERMRLDSSGNVGIGTTSPAELLHVYEASTNAARIRLGNTDGYIEFGTNNQVSNIDSQTHTFRNEAGSTEYMRIDSDGNLLVGKTTTTFATQGAVINNNGSAEITKDGGATLFLNRKTSDGDIVAFYKDGSTVGSIGTSTDSTLIIGSGNTAIEISGNAIVPRRQDTGIKRDDAIDLGESGTRFKDIYATNGTIQTSDRNEKQDIEVLSEAEQRVAVACKGLLRKFRWKSAVEEKGDDARIHFGIIAQDLQDAFTAEGLDAGRYAMFIHSTWTDEETGEERSRMGVRYSELLAFIIAAI
jgi:hypothetical protein